MDCLSPFHRHSLLVSIFIARTDDHHDVRRMATLLWKEKLQSGPKAKAFDCMQSTLTWAESAMNFTFISIGSDFAKLTTFPTPATPQSKNVLKEKTVNPATSPKKGTPIRCKGTKNSQNLRPLGQAEILPLLLRVLKALKGGSCDARRKAAERCLAELEAVPG